MLVIPGDDVTVGRAPDNQLVIPESSISPHHARLQRKVQGWVLTDLGQTNGIWVGVKRVTEHQLSPGQLFRIGGVALEFVDDGARPSDLPTHKGAVASDIGSRTSVQGPSGIKDPTMRDSRPPSMSQEPLPERRTVSRVPNGTSSKRAGLQSVVGSLLAMVVLGFAITLGGYFALRWMGRVRTGSRPSVSAAVLRSLPTATAKPPPPEALLADRTVTNIAEELRIDVPNTLRLVLPSNALQTPTHVVVARATQQGTPFCNATNFAGSLFEIATASNPVWSQPGTVELAVDVDQLAKTHVSSLAIGLMDPGKQEWQLLPTEYDSTQRIARAQFWQPGLLALFFVRGVDSIATSEHFSMLLEPEAISSNSAMPPRAASALAQLESALKHYRAMGYRVPNGSLWVCAGRASMRHTRGPTPAVHVSDLTKPRSLALARSAFVALWPAYLNSHSVDGREFWFEAMSNAIASHALGHRVQGSNPTLKRLSSSLLAEDGPSSPLFVNLVARIIDQQVDLFRLWTDTTHIMSELDTKPNSEGQSRVLPIDLALEQATHRNLLDHYADLVKDRILNASGVAFESAPSERCSTLSTLNADSNSGDVQVEIPAQYTARWACISVIVPQSRYRSIRIQWMGDAPPGLNLRLLRLASGESRVTQLVAARPERFDLENSETLIVVGINSSMAQAASVTLHLEDATIEAVMDPASPIVVRPGQIVSSTLQLAKIPPELKNLDVEWDCGDGSPKNKVHLTAGGVVRSEQSHAWTKIGAFTLRASVFDADHPSQEIGFAIRQVTTQPVQLELSVTDANPQAQDDVHLTIRATGPLPDALQYRINFGEGGEPLLTSSPEATHRFANAGQYAVSAELVTPQAPTEVIAVSKIALSVRAADVPTPVVSPQATVPPESSTSVQ
jgi:hypothetical protein